MLAIQLEYALQKAWEQGRDAAAEYMERCAERWVESLPIDEIASLNCKQAAKGIRKLDYPGPALAEEEKT